MEAQATKKVPGGKLLRVKVSFEGSLLHSVQITGDFFMHPEDALLKIEEALLNTEADQVEHVVYDVVTANNVELVGLTSADISDLITEAMQ